jgi:hypothetical protein
MRNILIFLAILVLVIAVIIVGAWVINNAGNYFSQNPGIGITIQAPQGGTFEPLPLPTFPPTATPVPNPVTYKAEVLLRLKRFALALDSFYAQNDKLAKTEGGMQNETWRQEMRAVLAEVVASGEALGQAGPAPAEWSDIQVLLEQVGPEVEQLRSNYLQGIETGDQNSLKAAGENLKHIQDILTQVQVQTARAGW